MWPATFWEKLYEPLIRRAAGLGRAAGADDPDHYEKAFAHCDVLVVGGGPAGLAAALAAGRAGARVILCDEDFRLGGRLAGRAPRDRRQARRRRGSRAVEAELAALPDVRLMRAHHGRSVFYRRRHLRRASSASPIICRCRRAHQPRQRCWKIVAKRAVLAAGALERPIVFGGNDRPGVMLAGAVRTYINRYRRRRADASRSSPTTTTAGAPRADRARRRHRDRRGGRLARRSRRAQFLALGVKAHRPARRSSHVHGRHGVAGDRRDRCATAATDEDRMRRARGVGRLESRRASDLPSRRQAGVERGARRLRPRRDAARHARRRRGRRQRSTLADCLVRRRRGRRDGGGRMRLPHRARSRCRAPRTSRPRSRRSGTSRQAARRPSSISRTTSPPTTSRSPIGRLPLGRASQALHDARHGDRSGQDRRTSPASRSWPRLSGRTIPRGRHHDLSARPTRR